MLGDQYTLPLMYVFICLLDSNSFHTVGSRRPNGAAVAFGVICGLALFITLTYFIIRMIKRKTGKFRHNILFSFTLVISIFCSNTLPFFFSLFFYIVISFLLQVSTYLTNVYFDDRLSEQNRYGNHPAVKETWFRLPLSVICVYGYK